MHSSLEPRNYSVSELMAALIWPLQRREEAVKTKRKESLYRIFHRRNVQFPRLQRLTASIFWWLCTLFKFSYFYTFSTGHKGRYISDFSFMGEIECSVCLCFCHFGPARDTCSIMMKVPRWVDVYGVLKASPTVGGIFMGYKSDILAAQDELSPLTSD